MTIEESTVVDYIHNFTEQPKSGTHNENLAASAIKSCWKMHNVKKKISLPSELHNPLSTACPDLTPSQINNLSKIISRQMINLFNQPEMFKGKGKRINAECKEIFAEHPNKYDTTIITTPRTMWMQLSDDSKSLKIQIYSKKIIGEGSNKVVKASNSLIIDLSSPYKKKTEIVDTVFVKSKNLFSIAERNKLPKKVIKPLEEKNLADLKSTIECAKIMIDSTALQEGNISPFKGLPEVIRTHIGKNGFPRLEWEEPLYTGKDFLKASNKGFVNLPNGSKIKLSLSTKFRVISDILYACKKIHEKGMVHCDVKSANIFLTYNGEIRGQLGDFDLLKEIGTSKLVSNCPQWDLCSCFGLSLPTTDLFGILYSLCEVVLGESIKDISILRFEKRCEQKISTNMLKLIQLSLMKKIKQYYSGMEESSVKTSLMRLKMKVKKAKSLEQVLNSLNAEINLGEKHITTPHPIPKDLYKELLVTYHVGCLMTTMFKEDLHLHNHLFSKANKSDYSNLASGNQKLITKTMNEIYTLFPFFKNLDTNLDKINRFLT